MDLASAVPISISGPFVDPMANGGMGWMAAVIALPFIGVEDRALPRDILGDELRLSAWSHTQKRCSPVSREMMLMIGGRSLV